MHALFPVFDLEQPARQFPVPHQNLFIWRADWRNLADVKLISWNVNGLRSVLKKNFLEYLAEEKPDILCLQETKCAPEQVEEVWPKSYSTFWNSAEKKGYSGIAIFSKERPISVVPHIGISEHDKEGRVLTAEYADFYLVNVYVPNSKRELTRLAYRQQWDKDFLAYLKNLEKKKPVIWCGDLNVAHTEIDLANPKSNVKNHGFTPEERAGNLRRAGDITVGGACSPAPANGILAGASTIFSSPNHSAPGSKKPSSAPKSWAATIVRWELRLSESILRFTVELDGNRLFHCLSTGAQSVAKQSR
jgi:exodeoxyribonuclease III